MNSSGVTPRVPDSCAEQGRAALAHAMAPMLATTIANRSSDLSQQRSFAIIPHSQLQLTNRNSRLASRQQQITNHEEQLNHQSTNLANYQSRSPDHPMPRSADLSPLSLLHKRGPVIRRGPLPAPPHGNLRLAQCFGRRQLVFKQLLVER